MVRLPLAAAWPSFPYARHAPIRAQHSTSYHAPVLCDATIKYLVTDPAGTYADGTLGGGGHSEALLEVLALAEFIMRHRRRGGMWRRRCLLDGGDGRPRRLGGR